MRHHRKVAFVCILLAAALGVASVNAQGPQPFTPAAPLGSGFTYQGQLKQNSIAVNSSACSLAFSLWDAQTNGNQLGSVQLINPVNISNGSFTVLLNGAGEFGANAFDGNGRWLQTRVQCPGDGSPVALSRQPVTVAPYALFAAGPWLTNGSNLVYNGGSVGIGTANPTAKLAVQTAVGHYGFVHTDGSITVGSWLGGGIGTPAGGWYGTQSNHPLHFFVNDGAPSLTIQTSGSVGIGETSPTSKLDVRTVGSNDGVFGYSPSGHGVFGQSGDFYGVEGFSTSGVGVYGGTVFGVAGSFAGNVNIMGTLSKTAGSFKIDHPLDPANQYLLHSFVESPDMLNIYNGNVTTDANGDARIELPVYFEALNQDYRYQLTVIGTFAQAIVSSEIQDNRFSIKTDKPNVKVSWQVTGIRHDPYAEQHRIVVEQDKPEGERGKYLFPGAYGQPAALGIGYEQRPAAGRP